MKKTPITVDAIQTNLLVKIEQLLPKETQKRVYYGKVTKIIGNRERFLVDIFPIFPENQFPLLQWDISKEMLQQEKDLFLYEVKALDILNVHNKLHKKEEDAMAQEWNKEVKEKISDKSNKHIAEEINATYLVRMKELSDKNSDRLQKILSILK